MSSDWTGTAAIAPGAASSTAAQAASAARKMMEPGMRAGHIDEIEKWYGGTQNIDI
jgi:hypothetical protein